MSGGGMNGGTVGGVGGDLDALMGRLELEAARRRADPRFPIDADARLGAELDALAPGAAVGVLDALAAAVAALPMPDITTPPAPGRRRRRAAPPDGDEARLREVGLALAAAIAAVARRVDVLEASATLLSGVQPSGVLASGGTAPASGGEPPGPGSVAEPGPPDTGVGAWGPAMVELLAGCAAEVAATGGRVWWSGPDPTAAVAVLRAAGADAYATDPAGQVWTTGVDGRRADPLEHLRSVADGALSAAVLAGPLPGAGEERLSALCAALHRCAATVLVCSPTPAWWRALVGPATADLAADRPLAADTWIGALGAAGWDCHVDSGHGGRTYRLWASRSAGALGASP